jgi:thiamine-monophosphate kinase
MGGYANYNHAMDEFGIIAKFFAPLAADSAFGLKDDAALLPLRPGQELVVTTDTISQGTDFFPFDPADSVAQKALRVNLSDLAAKGAEPAYYLLNLTLPHSVTPDWLSAFSAGLARDQQAYGISLLGGDTSASEGPLTIAITAFGFVPQGKMLRRSGARVGDGVFVTGTIGDSGGGLAIFRREKHALPDPDRDYLTGRYRLPQPPVGFALRDFAHASVDVSDGLMADLGHIASASGVRIQVEGERVPLSAALRSLWGEDAVLRAVSCGDDYQIAFTAPASQAGAFTRIGQVVAGQGVSLTIGGQEIALPKSGYRHFR